LLKEVRHLNFVQDLGALPMPPSAKPIVVVSETLNENALKYLSSSVEIVRTTPKEASSVVANADALIVRTYTRVDESLLECAPKLRVVGRAGVALDNIDVSICRARGIEVVHTPEANTLAVVDYTVRMILEMNRRFWALKGPISPEEFHKIRKQTFGRFLSSLTLGIVGCGRIGSRVGRAAAGLGMKVLYNDILDIHVDYPARSVDKPTLYAESDIITIHVPLTDLTHKFINAESIGRFKTGAQFINCARGACVDYDDLASAITTGRISAVAIDCHDPEPPPPDYPMFNLGENVILTPHIAARVPEAMERMSDVVYDVVAVLNGEPPRFPAPSDA
jgi:D-3-phosphoglycerate dehydrogenase